MLVISLSLVFTENVHAISVNATQGTVGLEVDITGLTPNATFTIQWDSVAIKSGTTDASGNCYYNVPEAYGGGTHTVNILCSGSQVYSGTFSVLPNITIDPTNGAVGTNVSVSGHGFAANEANVTLTYDGASVKTGLTADATGAWSTSYAIPASTGGNHTLDAYGATTAASSVTDKYFKVTPTWTIDPKQGGAGAVVAVTGSGFGSAESGIKIFYSDKEVRSGVVSDATGSWSTTFSVPNSTRGAHIVSISGGSTTLSSTSASTTFTVAPSCNINPNTGYVDDSIKVNGSGFNSNETSIEVLLDGNSVASNIIADSDGFWSTSIKLPPCTNGTHTIGARGRLTSASEIATSTFTTQAQVTASPKSGNVGTEIRINGTGFTGSKDFDIYYDNNSVMSGSTNDAGSLVALFKAPGSKGGGGARTIKVTDIKNVSASTTFSMDANAPDTPKIASPKDGSTIGFMGGSKVNFSWSSVTDPSGVTYTFEVSDQQNFAQTLMSHSDLTDTKYYSTESESLQGGEYYWRVRAIDGAGNASAWSPTTRFKVGVISTGLLISILVGIVVVIIIILVLRRLSKMKREKSEWE